MKKKPVHQFIDVENAKQITNFAFTDRLEKNLMMYLRMPESLPTVSVFHGYPGTGKTSVANHIATHTSNDAVYFPCNELVMNDQLFSAVKEILEGGRLSLEEGKYHESILVLDEFHNLSHKQQDRFKTIFDRLEGSKVRVIVCLNTERNLPLEKVLTKAIYSRLVHVDFNILNSEVDEVAQKSRFLFPLLSKETICQYLPDFRKLLSLNTLASFEESYKILNADTSNHNNQPKRGGKFGLTETHHRATKASNTIGTRND